MKKNIFTIIFVLTFVSVSAQQASDLAMRTDDGLEVAISSNAHVEAKYTLESYGNYLNKKAAFDDEHFLGGETMLKWNLFQQSYKRVYEQTVGLSGSTVEILKPTVYNAVSKVNNYYKKIFKSGELSQDAIAANLNHVLDCANLLCYEEDTKKIELELKTAKNPQDIIRVFNSIRIIQH